MFRFPKIEYFILYDTKTYAAQCLHERNEQEHVICVLITQHETKYSQFLKTGFLKLKNKIKLFKKHVKSLES